MANKLLLDSDSDSEKDILTVNESYAKSYLNWREKEEYQKLKDKYGDQILSEASELSETDDSDEYPTDEEYENQMNQEIFDDQFLKVYGALKSKDPSLYDEKVKFYSNQPTSSAKVTKKEPKKKDDKLTLADYHIKLVLEKKGVTEEDEQENTRSREPGYYEELNDIKSELKAFVQDDSDDDLITGIKPSTTGESEKSETVDNNVEYIKHYWQKDVDEKETFIRDYILNKKYIEKPSKPSFMKHSDNMSDDDEQETQLSDKEINNLSKIKHRFEEPGASEIKRIPRNIDSARDLPAKELKASQRQEKREKKQKEKDDGLKRLTELKMKEIQKKLDKLREISGNDKLLVADVNIDALVDDEKDFDPDKYDQYMSALFGDNYYSGGADSKKPRFEYVDGLDDEINAEMESKPKSIENLEEAEESPSEKDDDGDEAEIKARQGKSKKNRKRKQGIVAANKLDSLPLYEDIIGGDLPTRFKYRQVQGNSFGLTNEELLFADDQELNKWASLKKATMYRTEDEEHYDIVTYERKANDMALKKQIFKSLYEIDDKASSESHENINAVEKVSKKKRRAKKKSAKSDEATVETIESKNSMSELTSPTELVTENLTDSAKKQRKAKKNVRPKASEVEIMESATPSSSGPPANNSGDAKKSRKRKNAKHHKPNEKKSKPSVSQSDLSVDRLKAYGLSKKEMKKRKLV
ncbi:Protein KRI1 -like protein [Halotydeus destructor]|nr:Protein KRI1 -like protein [Halotydeus destructor]